MAHQIKLEISIGFFFAFVSICGTQFVDVGIPGLGTCRGLREKVLGNSVDVFKGIPYAKPPVGPLRFKPPEDISWTGMLNSTTYGSICPQMNYLNRVEKNAKEDCLSLNIYKPNVVSGKLAVMFWIHGGGYQYGSSHDDYDGGVLASQHDVVVVTINYRLGILGFFNIPGTDIRGNYGMLDQIAALRWVKKNIASFGGDPNKVTIFGGSAGSSSVSLLTVSPLIKKEKLFIRAILQSGSATCPWAVYAEKSKTIAKLFGSAVGCTNLASLVDCLRGKTIHEIIAKQILLGTKIRPLQAPTVDGHFLTQLPWKLQQTNRLEAAPIEQLIGFNNDEGTLFAGYPNMTTKATFKTTIESSLSMRYNKNTDLLRRAMFYEYTKYCQPSESLQWYDSTAAFVGDFWFVNDIIKLADALVRKNKTVFFYKFTYFPKYTTPPFRRVAHAVEIASVFGNPLTGEKSFLQVKYTEEDKVVSKNVMKLWTNFAKRGYPGNNWPKYTRCKKECLDIGYNLKLIKIWRPKLDYFWNKVVPDLANFSSQKSCKIK